MKLSALPQDVYVPTLNVGDDKIGHVRFWYVKPGTSSNGKAYAEYTKFGIVLKHDGPAGTFPYGDVANAVLGALVDHVSVKIPEPTAAEKAVIAAEKALMAGN